MHVLVTGATGVIGRRAIPLLLARGHSVTAVARSPATAAQIERSGATPITLDLFDAAGARLAMTGHDAVINLATHIPGSTAALVRRSAWRENDRIRAEASAVLTAAAIAAGVKRFIQESFAPIYADGGDAWLGEESPVSPVAYNESVLVAERHADALTRAGGTGVILRFAYFFGPDSDQLPDLLRLLRVGWFGLPGRADAFLPSVTHDDAASAVVGALAVPAGVYNVSDDEPLRRREFADALAAAFGRRRPRLMPAWLQRFGGLMALLGRSQRLSNRKLRDAAEWAPATTSMREGWRRIAEQMGQNRNQSEARMG